ncbi:FAD-binding domain-containing protein [Xylaria acuta]|nr:FAD-binding domain-containing protein [Xylaria acuta]
MASLYTSVQTYLEEQKSTTKLVSREHPDFEALQACFAKKPSVQPALIAHPQTAEDVQSLVRYCAQNKIEFVVCTGGHDCPGGTEEQDVLWIDMRDIDHVDVAGDKTTVKVGGGILFRGLTKALGEKGLVTPAATIANVGYVGWATLGGYGPFSALYGLGADQIVSAKAVNSKGELVEATGELLDCIIGGGGIFGVIVELTIKVYSLKEIISPTPLDESNKRAIRDPLYFRLFGIWLLGLGMIPFVAATWGGRDQEGNRWTEKIASLDNCGIKLSKSTTLPRYYEENKSQSHRGPQGPQGRIRAISFKRHEAKPGEQSVFASEAPPQMNELEGGLCAALWRCVSA